MKKITDFEGSPEDRIGRRLALRLDEAAQALPADISERLRFSRERAMARARVAQAQAAAASQPAWLVTGGRLTWAGGSMAGPVGTLSAGPGGGWHSLSGPGWSGRLASVLPLLILVLGFVVIQDALREIQIDAATEVDAALLSDDLPPQAYTDPGFAEFLRRESR